MTSTTEKLLRIASVLFLAGSLAVLAWFVLGQRRNTANRELPRTVAVLPFLEESSTSSAGIAIGSSIDLADRLAALNGLQCIARPRIEASFERALPANDLGKLLGAEILIYGRVTESAGNLRVAIEIIDAAAEQRVANFQYDESRERILDLHRQVARRVASELRLSLRSAEERYLDRYSTRSLKAWDDYARGLVYLEDFSNPRGPRFAEELFRRSLRLDPEFAQARARLSRALWIRAMHGDDPALLDEAGQEAHLALEADPRLETAVVAFLAATQADNVSPDALPAEIAKLEGFTGKDQVFRTLAADWLRVGELELAESAWLAAIEANPEHWVNPYGYGQFLLHGGRSLEAEDALATAARLAPATIGWPAELILALRLRAGDLTGAIEDYEALLHPLLDGDLIHQVAVAYAILGRLEPAEELFRRTIELQPASPGLRLELGDILARSGRLSEATDEYSAALPIAERSLSDRPDDPEALRMLSLAAAKAGECPRALSLAANLRRRPPESTQTWLDLALIFTLCQSPQLALDTLSAALDHGLSPDLVRSRREFESLDKDELDRILASGDLAPPDP